MKTVLRHRQLLRTVAVSLAFLCFVSVIYGLLPWGQLTERVRVGGGGGGGGGGGSSDGGGGGGDEEPIFDSIDKVLAAMPKAPMAFNRPAPMNIDDSAAIVELRVGPTQRPADLVKSITAPGEVQVHEIRISNRMRARLYAISQEMKVSPLTPALQAVSGQEPTVWRWAIQPLKSGHHAIEVAVEAVVKIDGQETPRLINTFDETIFVSITGPQLAAQFIKDNWQWLWTTLLVPVYGWWWKRQDSKNSKNAALDKHTNNTPKTMGK